jgi:hypothetical protein
LEDCANCNPTPEEVGEGGKSAIFPQKKLFHSLQPSKAKKVCTGNKTSVLYGSERTSVDLYIVKK